MNAERLHNILIDVNNEIVEHELSEKLEELRTSLQNVVGSPHVSSHQQELSEAVKVILTELEKVPSNNFSPATRQILEDIGISNYLGLELKDHLSNIFERNQITPATALEEIDIINKDFNSYAVAAQSIIEGFEKLQIGYEELEPGECEIGYTIPRSYIDNKLTSLKKEISELDFILCNISEIILGKKENFKVRTISSSDFLLYISVSLVVANVLSKAVERIINTYKNILEIKRHRNELKDLGVPTKETKQIEKYANTIMEEEIKKITNEIVKEYFKGSDDGRKNELSNGLFISLNKIANRIDLGFNIEIRVEPLGMPEEDKELNKDQVVLINEIQDSSKTLKFIKVSGKPILKLDETINKKKSES